MTRRKILVVEDNEQNLYLITFLLQNQGYEVVLAHSGLQAIEQAKIERPDLILLDIQLPEMDGYEATRKIRDIPEISHTPIVAVTSYAMVDDRTKALAAGCNGYMEKPIQPEVFAAEIGKYVGTVSR
jgi:two-component system cell cycle response regulator DivK